MSEDKNGKLLLIDDDEEYCLLVKDYMEFQNIMLDYALTGEAGFSVLGKRGYDLVLLDMMLPDVPGVEVLRRIRMKSSVPVIILSAHNDETDRIVTLEIGADDYISKPFSLREVIMRVKAVLRRTGGVQTQVPDQLTYKGLVVNIPKKKVTINNEEVSLTKKEFEILLLLLQNQGRVFSREDILAKVWHDEVYVLDRTIDVNITRLRKKIGEYGQYIVTRLGYGYCFECE